MFNNAFHASAIETRGTCSGMDRKEQQYYEDLASALRRLGRHMEASQRDASQWDRVQNDVSYIFSISLIAMSVCMTFKSASMNLWIVFVNTGMVHVFSGAKHVLE